MSIVLTDASEVQIPSWVADLRSFRKWVHSPAVPDDLRVFWIGGEVWFDMSKEQVFSHAHVKGEFARVLGNLAIELDLGRMFVDGPLYSNDDADIAVNPDGIFISRAARRDGRVKFVRGSEGGHVEVQGTPDMVLEVVSRSSVTKDTERLLDGYWTAGIPEYWLVDARKSPARFDIFRHTDAGYVATRRRDGWLKSIAFGKQFRSAESKDEFGDPAYTLEVK